MRISHIEAWPVKMPLSEGYTIAYERIESTTNVFMRIETDRGPVGFGCAAPDEQVTGERPESVLRTCKDIIEPNLVGADPLRREVLSEKLRRIILSKPSAMAMVDMALHDAAARSLGIPLHQLLGGRFRDRVRVYVSRV